MFKLEIQTKSHRSPPYFAPNLGLFLVIFGGQIVSYDVQRKENRSTDRPAQAAEQKSQVKSFFQVGRLFVVFWLAIRLYKLLTKKRYSLMFRIIIWLSEYRVMLVRFPFQKDRRPPCLKRYYHLLRIQKYTKSESLKGGLFHCIGLV